MWKKQNIVRYQMGINSWLLKGNQVDSTIYVARTTATDKSGKIVGKDDPYSQTVQIIKNIDEALKNFGSGLSDVVRTRIFVSNIENWEQIGKAHLEFFKDVKPVATMVEISRFIDPEILVEIEADALI
ncbi:RidA family protein [Candidatus Nitrosotenuis chungbukensis]|uniref:RidA family protein n=1 Tax=Candidatus Nitrosotenuis chungbukensis TaxID=1353246 RepID=UPI000A6EF22C|nr:RidA family protein [Candidatus Nitrosotenuis chungbukensis]